MKAAALPYTFSVKGKHWFFRYRGIQASLGTDFGSDRFLKQYHDLRLKVVGEDEFGERRIKSRVYFIGWRGGPIKVGVADNVLSRLNHLQTACPFELELFAHVEGGLKLEKSYHAKFSRYRLRGEWFERCPEIEAEIERLNAPLPHRQEARG